MLAKINSAAQSKVTASVNPLPLFADLLSLPLDTVKHSGIFAQQSDGLFNHWGLVTPFGDIDLGQHWLR